MKSTKEVLDSFGEFIDKGELIKLSEQELIDYLGKKYGNCYYDPASSSLIIYKKSIPFKLQTASKSGQLKVDGYALRFGGDHTLGKDLGELMRMAKAKSKEFILRDRLHAVVEGRIEKKG
jgi:hypothetical protein